MVKVVLVILWLILKKVQVLCSGKKATIYRPSVELYWRLKLERFSESDASDCVEYFKFCKANGDILNLQVLKDLLDEKQSTLKGKGQTARLQKLSKLLSRSHLKPKAEAYA